MPQTSLRVRGPHFASKVSYNAGAATDDCVRIAPFGGAARTCSEGLRRSTVAHFARKVRGAKIMAAKHELKIQQSHAPDFATCSWPSLCEQSELQCWRRNRRLCEDCPLRGRCANMQRRSEAKHCSSLCSQSEGGKYYGGQARAENPTKSCPKLRYVFVALTLQAK